MVSCQENTIFEVRWCVSTTSVRAVEYGQTVAMKDCIMSKNKHWPWRSPIPPCPTPPRCGNLMLPENYTWEDARVVIHNE